MRSGGIPGPLTLDKSVYQGLADTAQVTLNAPEANLDPSAKDTVPVKVTGDLNADGTAGLSDAGTALQILIRQPADVSPEYLNSKLSPSGNPAVSLEDIPYMLQKQSDLRP
jgi:hypothetical protein